MLEKFMWHALSLLRSAGKLLLLEHVWKLGFYFYIALAMLFLLFIVVSYLFQARVASAKLAFVSLHAALSKFSSCCFEGNTSG